MGANPNQAVKAFVEAESYPGPSLIIAYSQCINHGIDMTNGYEQQRKAVECGHWPLYRFNPLLAAEGKNPLQLDSKPPTIQFADYAYNENRYRTLKQSNPEEAARLMALAEKDVTSRFNLMQQLAALKFNGADKI